MNKFIPFLSIIRLSLKDFNWFSTINANDTRKITAIIFFLSGFSSLLYQTTWQRILTQEIGVDFLSITFIVTIFMIGLGFGALWGGKVSLGVSSKNLLKLYAIIEIAIGAFGFFSIQLIRWANKVNLSVCSNSVFCDFIINLLVLSIPTLLMGMTTPIVIHFLRDKIEDFGETIGIFYGINIIGAAIGSLSSIFLIELIKINGVIYLSATINIVIGAIFFIYGIKKLYIPKTSVTMSVCLLIKKTLA
ncbi:membrane protein [Candidatus Megaera polyxenophila]|nr:membrane protein [Candidatus Megaera polyxenophila]